MRSSEIELSFWGVDLEPPANDVWWSEGDRIEDWRFYIGQRARSVWTSFTREQKQALATDAHQLVTLGQHQRHTQGFQRIINCREMESSNSIINVDEDSRDIPEVGPVAAWSFIILALSPFVAAAGGVAWVVLSVV